jgi:hypothetical protein
MVGYVASDFISDFKVLSLTDFEELFHVHVWLQQVLPQVLERSSVGTVAAVYRRGLSPPSQHSGDSHMIPAAGKSTEQASSHQVTHRHHLCHFFAIFHVVTIPMIYL